MAYFIKCKLCPAKVDGIEKLRDHWAEDHQKQYQLINKWLEQTDEKLEHLSVPASEGMKGAWAGGRRKKVINYDG